MKKIQKNTILCVLLAVCLLISGCQSNVNQGSIESPENIEQEDTESQESIEQGRNEDQGNNENNENPGSDETQGSTEQGNTGQSAGGPAGVSARSEVSHVPISANARAGKQWKYINGLSMMLGKTAVEIVSESYNSFTYQWLENRSEVLAIFESESFLLFSGSIWGDSSYCTGIFDTYPYYLEIPEDIKRLPELYGDGAVWQKALNGEEAYYKYVFDDNIEVRFHSNPQGTRLAETVLIKSADTENLNGGISFVDTKVYPYPPPALRDKDVWQNLDRLDRYILYFDKTLEEITVDFPNLEYLTPEMGYRDAGYYYYEDRDSGARFYFTTDNLCDRVAIHTPLIFPDMGAQMTRAQLMEYWPGNYTWDDYNYCMYTYEFEGFSIQVHSDVYGSVSADNYVDIRK